MGSEDKRGLDYKREKEKVENDRKSEKRKGKGKETHSNEQKNVSRWGKMVVGKRTGKVGMRERRRREKEKMRKMGEERKRGSKKKEGVRGR